MIQLISFKNKLKGIKLNPDDNLVSFDIIFLFTKISLKHILYVIAEIFPTYITNLKSLLQPATSQGNG